MRLTKKLLTFLNDAVFDLDPGKYLAMRLQYNGQGLTWTVQDGVLTTETAGGSGAPLTVNLADYTVAQLAQFLGTQPGYSVVYVDRSDFAQLSALVLLDGTGDISASNGDHLYGYTNPNWSYMEANANELQQAEVQAGNAIQQLSTTTAQDMWLDVLGKYFGVPRMQGESDASYGPRIIAEVLRPRSNNIALELAISAYTTQDTTVTDVTEYGPTFPLYNGVITHDGSHTYDASLTPIYGLFDVQYGYDLINGGDPTQFAQTVIGIISRYRAAGTQLRNLILVGGSTFADTLTKPTDGSALQINVTGTYADTLVAPADPYFEITTNIANMLDALTAPTDQDTEFQYTTAYTHSSVRKYNSGIMHYGNSTYHEILGGTPPYVFGGRVFMVGDGVTASANLLDQFGQQIVPANLQSVTGIYRFDWQGNNALRATSRTNLAAFGTAIQNFTANSGGILTGGQPAPDGSTNGCLLTLNSATLSVSSGCYKTQINNNMQPDIGTKFYFGCFFTYVSGIAEIQLSLEGGAFGGIFNQRLTVNPKTGAIMVKGSTVVDARCVVLPGGSVYVELSAITTAAGNISTAIYSGQDTGPSSVIAWGSWVSTIPCDTYIPTVLENSPVTVASDYILSGVNVMLTQIPAENSLLSWSGAAYVGS